MKFHPDVLAAHAQFGGDLEDMQRRYTTQPTATTTGVTEAREGTPAALWRVEGKPDFHGKRYDCERADLAGGDLTDDQVANAVFMRPDIGNLTIAKDRIRWLSRALEAALSSAPSGDGVPGMVLVPKTALDWLFGEGQDSEGRWFYEFPEGVEPPTEQYWWRTPFRKMLAASSGETKP